MLGKKQKKTLIVLIGLTLIMIFITLYLSTNYIYKKDYVVNKRIHIIHVSGDFEPNFKLLTDNKSNEIGKYDIEEYSPLLNAYDVIPEDWNNIAKSILSVYEKYDAFVIVHGRETLSYTSSALSFMLENLSKIVIFTDEEVFSALMLASRNNFPEVVVASRGVLTRACRTIPYSDEYFTSPNYPNLTKETSFSLPKDEFQIKFINPNINIIVIKVFPGIDGKQLSKYSSVNGIILETYGIGHSPTANNFLSSISDLVEKGTTIVSVSQSNHIQKSIDTDIRLINAGVISGYDMTTEAAFCKLYYLLSNVEDKKIIGKLIEKSFRGEI